MQASFIPLMVLFLSLIACSVDYYPDKGSLTERDRLIVNSYLEPGHKITVFLHATYSTGAAYHYKPVKDAYIRLKEDDRIIYWESCPDTVLVLNHYPKIASVYSIEVSLEGYETVSASTRIPEPISCLAQVRAPNLFKLSEFCYPNDNTSLWISMYNLYEDGEELQYSELYANNLLVDRINRLEGSDIVNQVVGSGYHEGFLRIKPKHLPALDSLLLTPMFHVSRIEAELKQKCIRLVAASKEYDQYNKTFYQQVAVPDGGDLTSILYQPIHVYCNVANGLGIFAGINESIYCFEVIETNGK